MVAMADMRIAQLSVDLLSGQASISIKKQHDAESGRSGVTNITIMFPTGVSGNVSESHLKRTAIGEGKKVLSEAIQTLDRHRV